MDRFKGILICSDMDGTFCGTEETIFANKKAVEYFTKHGGRFTFSTGRNVAHLLDSDLCNIINAPACLLNGSVIYDYKQNKILYKKQLDFSIKDFISKVKKYSDNNFTVHAYCGCEDSDIFRISLNNLTFDLPNITPLKIVRN